MTTIAPYEYANVDLADQLQRLHESSDPWQRCMGAYLQEGHARSGSWATTREYHVQLGVFLRQLGGRPLETVTREDVLRFLALPCQKGPRKGQPPSVSTRNQRLSAVHGLYDFASTYSITGTDGSPSLLFEKANPAARIPYGKVSHPYHVLSEDELTRFFSVINTSTVIGARDFALCSLYFLSARRAQEILQLRGSDIQEATFTENGVTRAGLVFRFYGKGRRRVEDFAEMPAAAWAAIEHYLKLAGRWPLDPDAPIFVATQVHTPYIPRDPYAPIHWHTVSYRLHYYAALAGLDKKISTHWFRHTSARQRLAMGASLQELQRILRHQSIATTDLYVRGLVVADDPGSAKLEQRFAFLSR